MNNFSLLHLYIKSVLNSVMLYKSERTFKISLALPHHPFVSLGESGVWEKLAGLCKL